MSDSYVYRVKRVIQGTIMLVLLSVLGWGFTPASKWFAGLILGLALALLSTVFTALKVHQVVEKAVQDPGRRKHISLGTFARFSMAILATVIALQFPHIFAWGGVAIGLILPSFVAYGDAIYIHIKAKKRQKGVNRCAY